LLGRLVVVGGILNPTGARIALSDLAGKSFKSAVFTQDGVEATVPCAGARNRNS
jgi:hypothetical protein